MLHENDLFNVIVSEEFKCSICLCVLREATQLNCEHLFCKECITTFLETSPNTKFCPIDRKPASLSDLKPAHVSVRNIISKLEVKFRYHSEGCKVKMLLENLDKHDIICSFGPCPQPNGSPTGDGIVTIEAPTVPINVVVKLADSSLTAIISCSVNDSVYTFKRKIQDREGIRAEEKALFYGSKALEDSKLLIHYNIYDECVLFSTRRFLGGF